MHTDDPDLAWSPDLAQKISGRVDFDPSKLLVGSRELSDFVNNPIATQFLVSGARGMGKSLALACKVIQLKNSEGYRERTNEDAKPYRMLPDAFPFMFSMNKSGRVHLSGQQLYELESAQKWEGIWLACLGTYLAAWILRDQRQNLLDTELGLPAWSLDLCKRAQDCLSLSPREEPFSSLLRVAIRLSGNDMHNFYEDHLTGLLKKRSGPIALCIDGIDEAIGYLRSVDGKSERHSLFTTHEAVTVLDGLSGQQREESFSELARGAWIAAQRGYAAAAASINQSNAGIRVLGSMRMEARLGLPASLNDVEKNWEANIFDLSVQEQQFHDIFLANIDRSDEERMAAPQATNLMERFAGVAMLPPQEVPDTKEPLLQYILRKTFRTPRGMVQIGGAIYAKQHRHGGRHEDEKQHVHRIISAVNACAAGDVFAEHLSQQMPPLDPQVLTWATGNIRSNILNLPEVRSLNKAHQTTLPTDKTSLSEHLFAAGLLGVPREMDGQWRQFFVPHRGASSEDDWQGHRAWLERARFYVLHPAFSAYVCRQRGLSHQEFYRSSFLVGDGLPCPEYFFPGAVKVTAFDSGSHGKQLRAEFQAQNGQAVHLQLRIDSVAYLFFFSMVYALFQSPAGTTSVDVEDIADAAQKLFAAGYLHHAYGRGGSTGPEKYLKAHLEEIDIHKAPTKERCIRVINDWFKKYTREDWDIHIEDEGKPGEVLPIFSLRYRSDDPSQPSTNAAIVVIDKLDIDFRATIS